MLFFRHHDESIIKMLLKCKHPKQGEGDYLRKRKIAQSWLCSMNIELSWSYCVFTLYLKSKPFAKTEKHFLLKEMFWNCAKLLTINPIDDKLCSKTALATWEPHCISLAVIKLETFLIKDPVMIEFIAGCCSLNIWCNFEVKWGKKARRSFRL